MKIVKALHLADKINLKKSLKKYGAISNVSIHGKVQKSQIINLSYQNQRAMESFNYMMDNDLYHIFKIIEK